ncbi:MAG: DUF2306 domain-containing protein [Actinomycetota bacterium]|nr:DUF2306 domain-containing protein [Actinomycetota bacterium]
MQLVLVAFVAFPAIAGTLRLVELAGGPATLPADPRMTSSPLPIAAHVVGAIGFAVLGALQLSGGLRRRYPGWHRMAGRITVALGLAVAISALWMTIRYARQPGSGEIAFMLRIAFSSLMAACLVLGVATVRRGDVAAHRAWMIRAYAIALAAATQMFTLGFGAAILGTGVVAHDVSLGSAWLINLAVAEVIIRRGMRRRPRVGAPRPAVLTS